MTPQAQPVSRAGRWMVLDFAEDLAAQRQALEHGVKVSGCTVHFVDETLDGGPIIAQRAVPVLDGDTVETLSARILEQEHILYPEAIAKILSLDLSSK